LWTIRIHGELRALESRGYVESFIRTSWMFRLTDKGRKQLMAHMKRVYSEVSAKRHFESR
jgi:DNA-binding PadR family transcriptional regulator